MFWLGLRVIPSHHLCWGYQNNPNAQHSINNSVDCDSLRHLSIKQACPHISSQPLPFYCVSVTSRSQKWHLLSKKTHLLIFYLHTFRRRCSNSCNYGYKFESGFESTHPKMVSAQTWRELVL